MKDYEMDEAAFDAAFATGEATEIVGQPRVVLSLDHPQVPGLMVTISKMTPVFSSRIFAQTVRGQAAPRLVVGERVHSYTA